jgi:hypothetical protein
MVISDVDDGHLRLTVMFNNDRLTPLGGANDLSGVTRQFGFSGMINSIHTQRLACV